MADSGVGSDSGSKRGSALGIYRTTGGSPTVPYTDEDLSSPEGEAEEKVTRITKMASRSSKEQFARDDIQAELADKDLTDGEGTTIGGASNKMVEDEVIEGASYKSSAFSVCNQRDQGSVS